MFCHNCGKELPDDTKFCLWCGTAVARPVSGEPEAKDPQEPAGESPLSPPAAPAAESAVRDAEPQPVVPVPAAAPVQTAPAAADGNPPVKRRGKAGLVVLGVFALIAVLAVVALVKIIPGLLGGNKTAYAYRTEDGELMYLSDLKEKTKALEISDEAGYGNVVFSPDGKRVYFTDGESTLYTITAAELKKGGEPERIARDASLSSDWMLRDGRLLYVQTKNGESQLNLYDKGESTRLLREYNYSGELSEDQKFIYYVENDESDYTCSLYRMAIAKDAEEERLLKGASTIFSAYDDEVLVYGVRPSEDGVYEDYDYGKNDLTVYSCKPGGSAEKLVEDVDLVFDVNTDGGKVSFYYYITDVEEHTLYEFVTDDMADEDAAVLKDDEPKAPKWYSDYRPHDL